MNLLPRDEKFFDLLQQLAGMLCRASDLLNSGLEGGYSGVCRISRQMEVLESNADEIVHDTIRRLRTTFITPIDPEDIQTLATTLDSVVDAIEDATFRISCYRIDPVPEQAVRLGRIIRDSCQAIARALAALRKREPVWEHCIEVNRLEGEADAIERGMLMEIFSTPTDAITVIKQKEMYESLENATDMCEDVADVIENIAVKNS